MIDLYMLCTDLKNTQSSMRTKSNNIILQICRFLNHPSERTSEIIKGWEMEFKYVYGTVESNLSSNNKLHIAEIIAQYKAESMQGSDVKKIQLLFYAIQTYFSILIKCVTKEILDGSGEEPGCHQELILGEFAVRHGIKNYNHMDFYCWPIFELENGFDEIIDQVWHSVANYRNELSFEDFAKSYNYDYIKQMYEAVIPKELRHALGEYYTPDWLAEETLNQAVLFYDSNKSLRLIDPTCGSGTFLFKAIGKIRRNGENLQEILDTVCGIDINPLAVLTAKTNYLLAVIDMLQPRQEIEIPVYNADIVRMGEEFQETEIIRSGTDHNPMESINRCRKKDCIKANNLQPADIIVGNPPWVNWEYMPEQYRRETKHLWIEYKLFFAKGRELSFSKEDISVLITYIVIDKLLKEHGILGFVIRQGVFKSAQNGIGFRRFQVKDEYGVQVLKVADLSKIKAFDNASNRTALFYAKKGPATMFPVSYDVWKKREDVRKLSFHTYSELREVKAQIEIERQKAMPAADELTSVWITARQEELAGMRQLLGENQYRARTGVFTGGANAVYWLNILNTQGNYVDITNVVERAKRKVPKVHAFLEKDYIFPMVKGSNVKRWNVSYDTYLLCAHTEETKMWPVPKTQLQEKYPKTFLYLKSFEEELNNRKGFAGWEKEIQHQEFHAILRVGAYTFSKYKVVWRYIASEFICAVISSVDDPFLGDKMLIPNEKIMYISTDDEMEAYYLCGILSSGMVANCIKSYMNPTSISTHVLNKLNIPVYNPENEKHGLIANLCKEGHGRKDIVSCLEQIDIIVKEIYGI